MKTARFFKKLEALSKNIIPTRFHPLLTPAKNLLMPKHYNRLTGIWFITWTCNFKCPYCWQREEPETYRRKYDITAKDWLEAWQRVAGDFDEIVLGISGGEPFSVRDFMEMLEKLPDNIHYDITSNLSFDVDRFLAINKVRKKCSGIVCSFHPTSFEDPSSYIDKFFKKVLKLRLLPHTRINFVAAPPNLKYYEQIKDFTDHNKIPLHVDKYSPLKEGIPFTDEERSFEEQIVSADRTKKNIAINQPVLCNGGVSHLTLLPDGSAFPCLKKGELGENLVGSFASPEFHFNKTWLRCSYYPHCAGCDLDNIKVKKS